MSITEGPNFCPQRIGAFERDKGSCEGKQEAITEFSLDNLVWTRALN